MTSHLTTEIAEQFCDDEDSVDLNAFSEIDPEAARILVSSGADVHLNGLTSLTPEVARSLADCEADLSLNGLRDLGPNVAKALSHHCQGSLSCDGLTHIADDAAQMLMRHPGHVSLRGVVVLSPKVASLFAFAPRKFTLGCSLPSTPSIHDLSSLWGAVTQTSFLTTAWPAGSQMLFAVGTNHRAQDVQRVIELIKESGSFLPPRAMLVPEPTNANDPHAVAVVFPTHQFGQPGSQYSADIKVGYLQRGTAVLFGETCAALGLAQAPVEVLACILVGKGPNEAGTIKVYLPNTFGELVVSGYTLEPASHLAWLADATPVPKKELTQNRAKDYTLDEQRKMYCRFAQHKGWNCLPDSVDEKVAAWRLQGLGPVGLAWAFHQDGVDSFHPTQQDQPTNPQQDFRSVTDPFSAGSRGSPIRQRDAAAVAREATLKTLFKTWARWQSELTAPTAELLATGNAVFADRFRELLDEEFEATEEKCEEKNSDRAKAKLFEQLLERVRKLTELQKWPGVDDVFDDFEIRCNEWIEGF
jgi:hypothetical protein